MLALECLGRRVSEERIQFKFARNPNYGDDVRWLLGIATKLGKLVKNIHTQIDINSDFSYRLALPSDFLRWSIKIRDDTILTSGIFKIFFGCKRKLDFILF